MKIDLMPTTANEKIFAKNYRLPTPELFTASENTDKIGDEDIKETCDAIVSFFDAFNTNVKLIGVDAGPRVARYIVKPDKNTRIKRVLDLMPDLHLYSCARSIRAVAPLEGTGNVGIEIDRKEGRAVRYREAIESREFSENESPIAVCLGIDVTGKATVVDLDRMNGLLISGCTGSGKSILIDNIIANILCKSDPHGVKLALIDPKMVEFGKFKELPHLYAPIAHTEHDTFNILEILSAEAERRLAILESAGKSFKEYNNSATKKLPSIVVIADEIADFMLLNTKNKFTKTLTELASAGSKCGIYVIIATQRPSADVLTKEIRDAFCSRACLRIVSYHESKRVLECLGAERLLFSGDMLFRGTPDIQTSKRIQVPFISSEEMDALIKYIQTETARCNSLGSSESTDAHDSSDIAITPEDIKLLDMLECENESYSNDYAAAMAEKFNFIDTSVFPDLLKAIDIAADQGFVSTSLLQRKMSIGFGKAARLIDCMEDMGFASEKEGAKPRKVLISKKEWDSISVIVKKKYHPDDAGKLGNAADELIYIPELDKFNDEASIDSDNTNELHDDMPDTTAISAALIEKLKSLDHDGYMEFMKAIEVAVLNGQISTALLQRKLSIGFGKAARFIDDMEDIKIVTPKEGAKPRTVLITREDLNFILSNLWE